MLGPKAAERVKLMSGLLGRLAQNIADGAPGADRDVIYFGLFSLLSFIAGYAALGVLSYALGIFAFTMIAGVSAQILRVFSGGAHAMSPWRCLVIGTAVFLVLGKTAQYIAQFSGQAFYYLAPGVVGLLGLAAVYRYGYATTHKKPLGSYTHGRKLRSCATALILVWLGAVYFMTISNPPTGLERIFVTSSLLGLAWQCFCLTPAGYGFSEAVDGRLKKMGVR